MVEIRCFGESDGTRGGINQLERCCLYEGLASGCPLKDLPSLRLMLSHVKEAGKSAPRTSSATGHRLYQ